MSEMTPRYNAVEQRIIDLLEDGNNHSPNEVMACFQDETYDAKNLSWTLSTLRKKLAMRGLDIVGQSFGKRVAYRMVMIYKPENTTVSKGT